MREIDAARRGGSGRTLKPGGCGERDQGRCGSGVGGWRARARSGGCSGWESGADGSVRKRGGGSGVAYSTAMGRGEGCGEGSGGGARGSEERGAVLCVAWVGRGDAGKVASTGGARNATAGRRADGDEVATSGGAARISAGGVRRRGSD
jgi:hypothetical protein